MANINDYTPVGVAQGKEKNLDNLNIIDALYQITGGTIGGGSWTPADVATCLTLLQTGLGVEGYLDKINYYGQINSSISISFSLLDTQETIYPKDYQGETYVQLNDLSAGQVNVYISFDEVYWFGTELFDSNGARFTEAGTTGIYKVPSKARYIKLQADGGNASGFIILNAK